MRKQINLASIAGVCMLLSIKYLYAKDDYVAYLNSEILMKYYRDSCPKNMSTLKRILLSKNIMLIETRELAANHPDILCDYTTNFMYKRLQNEDIVYATNIEIKEMGVKEYINYASVNFNEAYDHFKVDEIIKKRNITFYELAILVAVYKVRAKNEAVVYSLNYYLVNKK